MFFLDGSNVLEDSIQRFFGQVCYSKSFLEAIAKYYYWPTLIKYVTYWVRSCVVCQATKVTRYNRPKIGFFPGNTERFQFVHIDLVGPLNEVSWNTKFILTAKDRATGFLVTMPITDKKAVTVRNACFFNVG